MDDAPRFVLADWLREQGDDAAAEVAAAAGFTFSLMLAWTEKVFTDIAKPPTKDAAKQVTRNFGQSVSAAARPFGRMVAYPHSEVVEVRPAGPPRPDRKAKRKARKAERQRKGK